MIRIDNLEFDYGDDGFRLTIPELSIEKGQRVAIVGSSGSGKTSLLNLIAGASLPRRGSVQVNQSKISTLSNRERREFRVANIGFVFQDFELIDYLPVRENILLPFLINGALSSGRGVNSRLEALSYSAGLADKLARMPHQLSQGERQRVAVCRALINEPQLILADEPTGSLDPKTGGEILQLMQRQAAALGSTLLMVTHDHSQLSAFERVIDLAEFSSPADAQRSPE